MNRRPRWGKVTLGVVLVCLGAGVGGSARADNAATAREHYEKGTKFYDIGKYDDAIREFEAAYEAKSDAAFIYNLAQSHRLAGHNTEALQLYRNYLRYAPRAPNRADIEERIRSLEKVVADHPSAAPPTPTTGPAAPPESTPVVAAPPAGQTPPQPLYGGPAAPVPTGSYPPPAGPEAAPPMPAGNGWPAAQPAAPPAPPPGQPAPEGAGPTMTGPTMAPPPAAPAPHSGRKTAGIVITSVGGVFLVAGAVGGLIAKADAKKVEDAAANHDKFDPAVERAGRNAETFQWIGYGVGAAGVALGLILYATAPSPVAESAPPPRIAVAPLAGPGLGGAIMRVTF
jgi:tetratricopeptide (TPR) repeat protein